MLGSGLCQRRLHCALYGWGESRDRHHEQNRHRCRRTTGVLLLEEWKEAQIIDRGVQESFILPSCVFDEQPRHNSPEY